MYDFVDTTEIAPEISLPAEAMKINDVYLEDVISGYRTLYVKGRETPEIEVSDMDIGHSDGSYEQYRRYKPRTITVGFRLEAESAEDFRTKYNSLNSYIKQRSSKLIFADEPDKYYTGTFDGASDVPTGINRVISELSFYCADPFKYAVAEKTFTATDGVLTVENEGDVAVPIDYKVTMHSDNGYIGIVGAEGVMQYGLVEEADGEDYIASETLANLNSLINAADDHGEEAMHPYSKQGTAGTLGTKTWFNNTFLTLNDIGGNDKEWNGGMKTFTIPADSEGVVGAKNFYSYFHLVFYAGKMGQTGQMALSFLTADDTPICGVNWWKTDTNGNTGNYEIWAYDSKAQATSTRNQYIGVLKNWTFQCNHLSNQNPWFWDWGHCDLKKSGSKVTFFYWGRYYTYDLPEIEDMECAKIQFSVKWAKDRTGSKALTYAGLNVLTFRKDNVEKWKDVPNRYANGDVVEIKGSEGKVYVNGMVKMGDEVTGTAYFKAQPGTNSIEVSNSEWAEAVDAVATIREAWL